MFILHLNLRGIQEHNDAQHDEYETKADQANSDLLIIF